MRIVIDMQGAQTESRFRGIGRYTLSLVKAICRNAGENEIWLALNGQLPKLSDEITHKLQQTISNDRIVSYAVLESVSWETKINKWRRKVSEYTRESFLADLCPDFVLVTSLFEGANRCNAVVSVGALQTGIPTAVILYDLIPLLDVENYLGSEWVRQWYMNKLESLKKADLLLSISEYSRQEAINVLNISSDRIVNISTAHDEIFQPREIDNVSKRALFEKYGITSPYLMYNGALESRKNLDRLLEAFAQLPENLRSSYQLVFVGKVSEMDRHRLETLLRRLGCLDKFVFTGFVNDEDLISLFNCASLFVFPSLHEGFGLPALEAMACGTPTIGSNLTSIPEIIGRPDALFDPFDPKDISAKIINVLSNKELLKALKEHALDRSKEFSWDKTARLAIGAFENFLRSSSRIIQDWPTIIGRRKSNYQKLVDAVTSSPAASDSDLMLVAACIAQNVQQTEFIDKSAMLPESISWRLEGPFDSSYSLALLNRETARALETLGHQVALHSTEGPGDFEPDENFLRTHPELATFYERAKIISQEHSDVVSRNLYPPRVADMRSRVNLLHHFAWEETGFPQDWVDEFNKHLQGITCLSRHVQKILIDNGVNVPLSVSGCGVDHWERINKKRQDPAAGRSFKFLHVSSCFPRKGIDVLLDAFGRVFSDSDDVTLIIKTFRNPHNEISRWLSDARSKAERYPHVIIIEEDMTDEQLKALYESCDALIAPSRGEGFGLPIAEAMLSGLSVITTGWGGQLDFCNEETAWLIDYTFQPARSHFELFDSVWAEPSVDHLATLMREVHAMPKTVRNIRVMKGRENLLKYFRWTDVTCRLVESARKWEKSDIPKEPKIGWLTTWNTRCGIATYSKNIIQGLPTDVTVLGAHSTGLTYADGRDVVRCWRLLDDALVSVRDEINARGLNTIVIQFNYSFFNFEHLCKFLNDQIDANRVVIITLHSTRDPEGDLKKRLAILVPALRHCHRILVHAVGDLNRLKNIGLVDNVALFPHGIIDFKHQRNRVSKCSGSWLIGSYGFFLPPKGLIELIKATAILKAEGIDVRLRMVNAEYPVPESAALIFEAKEEIQKRGLIDCVMMNTNFLDDEESMELLAECDLIVFPYQFTGESASGAVRHGLAVDCQVAVTPLAIFDDVSSVVSFLPGTTPNQIAVGIRRIFDDIQKDPKTGAEIRNRAERWRKSHLYSRLGDRLFCIIKSLLNLNV